MRLMSVCVMASTDPTTMVRMAHDPDHGTPVPAVVAQRHVEDPQHRSKGGDLGD